MSREAQLVELVDTSGRAVGSATVSDAHRAPGMLHRAFSVFLRDPALQRDPAGGRVLLQQRAAVKTRFPLRWANTCCGHPLPGEDVATAARRRLGEELGLTGISLLPVGVYTYRAEDPSTGRVEHEYDHVLVGDLPVGARPQPDPDEVAGLRWVSLPDLLAGLANEPDMYAPWLPGVTALLPGAAAPSGSMDPSGSVDLPGPVDLSAPAELPAPAAADDAPERSGGG